MDVHEEGERFSDTSWQIHRQWREGEGPSWPTLRNTSPARTLSSHPQPHQHSYMATPILTGPRSSEPSTNTLGTPSLRRSEDGESENRRLGNRIEMQNQGQMELSYVTERILALWLPGVGNTNAGKSSREREAAQMLHTKHGQNYMIFNLSERRQDVVQEHGGRVCDLSWKRGLAPPLEGLCSLCKKVEHWLAENPNHIAVLRSCGNRERLTVAVSSFLQYSSICARQEQAVDRFAMRRFLDTSASFVNVAPSHRRYVEYFAGLLAGSIKVNASPLMLTHVTVVGAPPMSHVFLKLYEGIVPIYTSNVYSLGVGARQFTAALGSAGSGGTAGGVAVRGDVLLRCYTRPPPLASQSNSSLNKNERRLLFSCQFHTCAVSDFTIIFTKNDLDHACNDDQFPVDGSVEIQVAGGRPSPAPTPAVRVLSVDDVLSRWDSLQHLHNHSSDEEDVNGLGDIRRSGSGGEGPIYATVSRRTVDTEPVVKCPPARAAGGSGAPGGTSPLSASMDSGISSAGRRQGSPSPSARRRELDELLRDMMRTVEALPGPELSRHDQCANNERPERTPAPDIPYHARPDSRPFTYGSPLAEASMLKSQPGLSSPSLVRRALRPRVDDTPVSIDGFGLNGYSDRDSPPDPIDRLFSAEANESFRRRERREALLSRSPPIPPPLSPRREERRMTREELVTVTQPSYRPVLNEQHSHSGLEELNGRNYEVVSSRGEEGLTWLQRQQQRLRARRAARQHAARLPLERPLPPARASASHRFDGYTSDTTAFADDDDDFGVPLHIHTTPRSTAVQNTSHEPALPNRISSRKFMSLERTVVRERSVSPSTRGLSDMLDSPIGREQSLLSYADRSCNGTMTREESLSSWRSMSVSEVEGPEGEEGYSPSRGTTPAFPIAPCTPYPPATPTTRLPLRSPVTLRKDYSQLSMPRTSPSSNTSTLEPLHDVSPEKVKFVRDTSKFWYKPNISRDEAISLLQNQEIGAFIIRDSNSFPNAFGLALKVASPGLSAVDSVRHFLIEPTSRGVRLKGCSDEPVFSSLSALVYQHSVTPLALPVRLRLPGCDPAPPGPAVAARELLSAGAACSVLYLGGVGCEALTGPEAVARTTTRLLSQRTSPTANIIHFKVSASGITLTDSTRRLFFRRHYSTASVSHCGLDTENRTWAYTPNNERPSSNRIFGFVSRRTGSTTDNECHIFAELDPEQPATAIVNFVSKVMLGQTQAQKFV
ncbi:focal adhesion protein tensin isoform X2 [Arctopsyche grandis]|uniref:focal adhesion protein tensin isoform X2 n=1 Tax=Arctopsyche grandis TaxID=121162 RepID=UPI00406D74A8